jgi:hypothetical protein
MSETPVLRYRLNSLIPTYKPTHAESLGCGVIVHGIEKKP